MRPGVALGVEVDGNSVLWNGSKGYYVCRGLQMGPILVKTGNGDIGNSPENRKMNVEKSNSSHAKKLTIPH